MRVSICVVLMAALDACVAETTVVGDERSRTACAEADTIELPPSGCTDWRTIESSSPLGCTVIGVEGEPRGEEVGTWIRVHRPVDRPGRVEIRDLTPPHGPNPAIVRLSGGGSPPCTCIDGRMRGVLVRAETATLVLPYAEQELLFATPHTFEVRVCNDENDPFPRCTRASDTGLGACSQTASFSARTTTGTACACLPDCDDVDDCPVPITGDAQMTCQSWGCTMRCDTGQTCPSGYVCLPLDREGHFACARPVE